MSAAYPPFATLSSASGGFWTEGEVKVVLARGHAHVGLAISYGAAKLGGHDHNEPPITATAGRDGPRMATWPPAACVGFHDPRHLPIRTKFLRRTTAKYMRPQKAAAEEVLRAAAFAVGGKGQLRTSMPPRKRCSGPSKRPSSSRAKRSSISATKSAAARGLRSERYLAAADRSSAASFEILIVNDAGSPQAVS